MKRWISSASVYRSSACAVAMVALLSGAASALAAADVRILVDVSGSMKDNDPENLRIPAMRLVSELLPAGTRAGVWLFAEDTVTLIAPSEVDEAWRTRARKTLSQIHSRGLFTHIERAIDAAVSGWESEVEHPERHIVLLTDGVVDVSKTASDSAASRARIIAGQLQRLRSYDARVHIVSLSDNVDHELLQILTSTTGGLLESANDAERLQRIFLHMLEQTAAPVTVPLDGKQFDIDGSVSELTLLIFRADGEAVKLHLPSGEALDALSTYDGVLWRSEPGYDLITVTRPVAGTWRYEGTEDADNRAVVVTDLMLEVEPVPGTMLSSEIADLRARMLDHGEPLENTDLLEILTARVRIESDEQRAVGAALAFNPETRAFEGRLDGRALPAGDYRLTLTLDGGTFRREVKQRVTFTADPITVRYGEEQGPTTTIVIDVIPDPALTDIDSLSGYVAVTASDGGARAFPIPKIVSGRAQVRVEASMAGAHQFATSLYFTTRHGRSLHLEPAPQAFQMTHAESAADNLAAPAMPADTPVSTFSAGHALAYVGAGNALVILGFLAIWWLYLPQEKAARVPEAEPEAAPA